MKCISKKFKFILILTGLLLLTGCGESELEMSYDSDYPVSTFRLTNYNTTSVASSFAENLCVTSVDVPGSGDVILDDVGAAGLFDLNTNEVLFAKDIHAHMKPASLTKILTAITALKYADPSDVLVATENVYLSDPSAQSFGLKEGDSMTLDQALHILLINSANDVALMIAENVGGTVDNFCAMMNDIAKSLGATNTNYVNPHGLTADNHYTTAYDLYLMFKEAVSYEEIRDIISLDSYTTVYLDKNGKEIEKTVKSTNQYLTKVYTAPNNIVVLGGKTGTTNAAGNCLIILSKDTSGNQFISVILRDKERQILYNDMNSLLTEIGK